MVKGLFVTKIFELHMWFKISFCFFFSITKNNKRNICLKFQKLNSYKKDMIILYMTESKYYILLIDFLQRHQRGQRSYKAQEVKVPLYGWLTMALLFLICPRQSPIKPFLQQQSCLWASSLLQWAQQTFKEIIFVKSKS